MSAGLILVITDADGVMEVFPLEQHTVTCMHTHTGPVYTWHYHEAWVIQSHVESSKYVSAHLALRAISEFFNPDAIFIFLMINEDNK